MAWLGEIIDPVNPVEDWLEVGVYQTNTNPKLPSSASTQLNSTSTSIEAEIALFPFSDTGTILLDLLFVNNLEVGT